MIRQRGMKVCLTVAMIGMMGISIGGIITTTGVSAAENPAYTIKKKKTSKISTIIKKNPLTKSKQKTYRKLKWKSGNKKIVRIIGNKKIKGIKKGKVFIRGYNTKKKKVIAIRITVGTKVSKINVDSTKVVMGIGNIHQIKTTVSPKKASNKKVFYETSDPAVATVTANGTVTANKSGVATITITSRDTHAKKKVKIQVQSELVRTTSKGKVQGIEESNGKTLAWYGIPYGESTEGKNRWKAPQPVIPWVGIRQATTLRQPAAQYGDGSSYVGTEDCLYVNVYRPNHATTNLPVMVFLHGGGNASGSSDGKFQNFVQATNAIVVSVEYRLGAFGNLSHPALQTGTPEENSGNFALLDIQAALTWVRDEIANFGGNPSNVTLSGFSAGARNALMCMISPGMKGLFHKAIIMSGGCNTCTPEEGQESAEDKLASILVKRGTYSTKKVAQEYLDLATNQEIRALFDSLTTAEVAGMYKSSGLRLTRFPHGFADGTVIPKEGFDVIKSGNYNRVPMILGTDASEFSTYVWNGNLTSLEDVEGITTTTQMFQLIEKASKYGSMLQSEHYLEKTASLLYQDAGHSPIYAYRFKWGTNPAVSDGFYSKYVGAYHGSGKNFLLGIYKNDYTDYSANALSDDNLQGRTELTTWMQQYIGSFLINGNPNQPSLTPWGTWDPNPGVNKVMIFDANKKKQVSAMSSEHYRENETFQQMRANLTKSEYNIITKSLLAERFFVPENMPEY